MVKTKECRLNWWLQTMHVGFLYSKWWQHQNMISRWFDETNYESFTLKSTFVRSVHISCTVPSRLEHDAAFLLCSFEGFCLLQGCAERCLCSCVCQSRHAPIFSSMSTMAVWERIRVRHGRQVKVQYDGRKEIVTCEKPVATHFSHHSMMLGWPDTQLLLHSGRCHFDCPFCETLNAAKFPWFPSIAYHCWL